MKKFKLAMFMKILKLVYKRVSPALHATILKSLDDLHTNAKSTTNPFDDFLVEILKDIIL